MSTIPETVHRRWYAALAIALLAWFATVAYGGVNGWFVGLAPLAVPGLVALSIAVVVILYFALPGLRAAVRAFGLRAITLFHVWRIGAALLFFWYGAEGVLPERFVSYAGWGDLLAGLFAGLVVILPFRRSSYAAAHIFGFADLILAVGTGMTLALSAVPEMSNIGTFPLVMIPLFGVSISVVTHIVAFDLLLRPGSPERTTGSARAAA